MQHILFSVISAIIGINILVVSAQHETNQTPEFEHFDVESIVNIDATPYPYKEVTATQSVTIVTKKDEEPAKVETQPSHTNISETPVASESATTQTPTATNTPSITPEVSETSTPIPTSNTPTPTSF